MRILQDHEHTPEDILTDALDTDLDEVIVVGRNSEGETVLWGNITGRQAERLLMLAVENC